MKDPKDPVIKLFGKEITLSSKDVSGGGGDDDVSCSVTSPADREDRDEEQEVETEQQKLFSAEAAETMQQSSRINTSPDSVAPSVDEEEAEKPKTSKTVKKPDKILPCPRCNSTNTKFCYYNNYNVNQPGISAGRARGTGPQAER